MKPLPAYSHVTASEDSCATKGQMLLPLNQSQATAVLVGRDHYRALVPPPLEQSHPQQHPRAAAASSS